ncbi:hypothetical protein QFC22_005988 [Naganishia vaughanmartiniae]|uniref:Uncharacterized protein n=1 Tax=Naganishia vaughanmartiniae TaxID=1424756 RepID=A0ACC2WPI9_9TREE|nr:hypothetical protein QFC22_005988 [Naganishia vaughanmartiniae]
MTDNQHPTSRRPIRIGNVSGATGDASTAMSRMAASGQVDVITGDWLSEMNIAWNAIAKTQDSSLGYEAGFLVQLEESLDDVVRNGIKVITNAGALNTAELTRRVKILCGARGYTDVKVAAVIGDDITAELHDPSFDATTYKHIDHPEWTLADMNLTPHCGVAYIGCWGIVEALKRGADIVICGRVTDASPVIGAAAWGFDWKRDQFDCLAQALVAGHLIECGPYVTGANFSGFKPLLPLLVDLSFPIAEITSEGSVTITRCQGYGGAVTRENTIAQLLYEIQGELYLNSDVVADLRNVQMTETAKDRVQISGVKGLPPPSTTKAMIAAIGGYQAEASFYINGLDIPEKVQMMKQQLAHVFRDHRFSKLSIDVYGSVPEDREPNSQKEGTVMLRVFAQARKKEDIVAEKFKIPIYALRMQSYPGYHINLDFRTMDPKPFMEIFPVIYPLDKIKHQVILHDDTCINVPSNSVTGAYDIARPSYETSQPIDLSTFGPTTRLPLGTIVHARSGDKADNSNIGFFVRHADEYPWLQAYLTVERVKQLFGDDWKPNRKGAEPRVERCEFPGVFAVHFRVLDFLDGGIASSSRIDGLGKGIGEYLRSRWAELPTRFVERGKI